MHAGVPRRRPLPVLQRLRTSLSGRRTPSGRVVPGGGSGRTMSPRADSCVAVVVVVVVIGLFTIVV
jgi:hypothetical protein